MLASVNKKNNAVNDMDFAGYQLLEPLPEQGATRVYLALDAQSSRQRYAIKLLTGEFAADAEIAASFLTQARRAQEIRHPGFVSIYEYGEHDGAPFYVMDYVPGESLEAKRSALCLLDKIYLVKLVARSLGYIAKFDRVHGNINPANIWLHENDSRVVLTDCGFTHDTAYRITCPESAHAMLTGGYISPEQATFSATDPRSDLYSLGVVFYTLLVGTPPADPQNPVLPESKRIFQPLVIKAMAKDPGDRFQSASEFIVALDQISDEQILCADGIEVQPAQASTGACMETMVSATAGVAATAKVLPLKPKRKLASQERRAAEELAQVLKQSMAPVRSSPDKEAPQRRLRPVANPAAARSSAKNKTGHSDKQEKVRPVWVEVESQQTTGGFRKRSRHRGVAAGITLAVLAVLGFYGAQNKEQLAGIYQDYLAPALPGEVVLWWDDALEVIPALGNKLAANIVLFLRTGHWETGDEALPVPAGPIAHTGIDSGEVRSVNVSPDKLEPRDQADANILPEAQQRVADIAEQRRSGNFKKAVELAKSSVQLLPGDAKTALVKDLELQVAEQQQQLQATINKLLSYAESKIDAGQLLRPASDNAVLAYRRVLDLDPENSLALGALETLKTQALQQVRKKLDSGALNSADALITRIGVFFRTARPELNVLSTQLIKLRSVPVGEQERVLTQAFLEGQGEDTTMTGNSEGAPL